MKGYFINDRVVKKLLNSENKECREYLSRIISGVLKVDVEEILENIELIEPEVGSNINSVNSIVDVIYKSDNKYFNIEINYNNKRLVTVKNNIYLYNMVLRQVKTTKDYSKVLPVIQININNYDLFNEGKFIYESKMIEKETKKERDEMITIYDINLDYLKKIDYTKIIERGYNLEKILYIFICNEKEELDYIYKGDKVMEKVREGFDKITSALDEMLWYDPEELNRLADEYEREMARKEGRQEGIEEGLVEGKKSIVQVLLKKNKSIKEISELLIVNYNFF